MVTSSFNDEVFTDRNVGKNLNQIKKNQWLIIMFVVTQRKACRLHVAKWLMIVDLCLNLLEEIHIALLVNVYGILIHLVMQLIPVYFIFIVHSYENQVRPRDVQTVKRFTASISSNLAVRSFILPIQCSLTDV